MAPDDPLADAEPPTATEELLGCGVDGPPWEVLDVVPAAALGVAAGADGLVLASDALLGADAAGWLVVVEPVDVVSVLELVAAGAVLDLIEAVCALDLVEEVLVFELADRVLAVVWVVVSALA